MPLLAVRFCLGRSIDLVFKKRNNHFCSKALCLNVQTGKAGVNPARSRRCDEVCNFRSEITNFKARKPVSSNLPGEMFRVKTSQANTVNSTNALFFWSITRRGKTGFFVFEVNCEEGKSSWSFVGSDRTAVGLSRRSKLKFGNAACVGSSGYRRPWKVREFAAQSRTDRQSRAERDRDRVRSRCG